MSNRPTLPKPIPRWPFYLGDAAFLILAFATITLAGSPPSLGHIAVATLCTIIGIALLLIPFLLEYDARARFAEAQARDHAEAQLRRLAQIGDQLTNVLSRSQSTEEQIGQALGNLDEIIEKLGNLTDDLGQFISRLSTSEDDPESESPLSAAIAQNEKRLAALEKTLGNIASTLSASRADNTVTPTALSAALAPIREQLAGLDARLGKLPATMREPGRSPLKAETGKPSAPKEDTAKTKASPRRKKAPQSPQQTPADAPRTEPTDEQDAKASTAAAATPAGQPTPVNSSAKPSQPSASQPTGGTKPADVPAEPPSTSSPSDARPPSSTESPPPASPPAKKAAKPSGSSRTAPRKVQPDNVLELPLDGPDEANTGRKARRESGPATSLVATAYIGIGNKLFLRGEGPGLSWEKGVPMQFLAIGKWGWTSTEADGPVVCRIYRNDETPMLDEDIIIPAGSKIEVTPRF
ncbi:MAG: hypothetical protein D6781_09845 [Verrucomicrobia bacterium]|nr:MAG: hypothetical protein D6781_09845 [Verrucomicrobiota bacterium]